LPPRTPLLPRPRWPRRKRCQLEMRACWSSVVCASLANGPSCGEYYSTF
jgi:hypothetical protein